MDRGELHRFESKRLEVSQSPAFALAKGISSLLYKLCRQGNTRLRIMLVLRSNATLFSSVKVRVIFLQLNAENLLIERGARPVVEDLSFTVKSGEALVLTGPNGAGKTTLLRAIAGFLKPSKGTIVLTGGDSEKAIVEHCHNVGHANALKSALSVFENVAFWASFLGGDTGAAARTERALQRFGLRDLAEFPAGYLSAGQKRRLGLARLLAAERPIWLLDEPTVSLDTASTKLLSDAVNAHTSKGGIAIAATHLPLGLERARELALTGKSAAKARSP